MCHIRNNNHKAYFTHLQSIMICRNFIIVPHFPRHEIIILMWVMFEECIRNTHIITRHEKETIIPINNLHRETFSGYWKKVRSLNIQTCFFSTYTSEGNPLKKVCFAKSNYVDLMLFLFLFQVRNDARSSDLFRIFFINVSLFYDMYVHLFIYNIVKNFIGFSCAENFHVPSANSLFTYEIVQTFTFTFIWTVFA